MDWPDADASIDEGAGRRGVQGRRSRGFACLLALPALPALPARPPVRPPARPAIISGTSAQRETNIRRRGRWEAPEQRTAAQRSQPTNQLTRPHTHTHAPSSQANAANPRCSNAQTLTRSNASLLLNSFTHLCSPVFTTTTTTTTKQIYTGSHGSLSTVNTAPFSFALTRPRLSREKSNCASDAQHEPLLTALLVLSASLPLRVPSGVALLLRLIASTLPDTLKPYVSRHVQLLQSHKWPAGQLDPRLSYAIEKSTTRPASITSSSYHELRI